MKTKHLLNVLISFNRQAKLKKLDSVLFTKTSTTATWVISTKQLNIAVNSTYPLISESQLYRGLN